MAVLACTGALFVGTVPGGPTAAASALPITPKTHSHSRISDMGKSLSFDNMAKSGIRTSWPVSNGGNSLTHSSLVDFWADCLALAFVRIITEAS